MFQNFFDVEVDTQARPLRDLDVTIHDFHRVCHDLFFPRLVKFIEDLVNEEIGNRRIQLRAGRRANGALRAMRRDD